MWLTYQVSDTMSLSTAHRKFCDLPKSPPLLEDLKDPIGIGINGNHNAEPKAKAKQGDHQAGSTDRSTVPPQAQNLQGPEKNATQTRECLLRYIEENVIGKGKVFSGPYGLRKVEYCDYTASGRSLTFIEDYITKEVLPDYGNTHTTTTVTSLQTTLFRNEARDIVRNAVNASEHDAVIFVGSGCTAAVHKLLHALYLKKPPVVFVGPYEHHSNLLPWRETDAAVFRIRETVEGLVDLSHLEMQLKRWEWCGRQLIGCFSAASNVTGVLTDVNAVTILLHRHGAFAFWDYATAGAYAQLDMNPVTNNSVDQAFVYKDAMFLSPHKFVGGVQTPGVLVAKKSLFKNPVPSHCGGGSVFFVRRAGHRYLQEAEAREEGGTPAIVESVRAGLVFQLKEALGSHVIMDREHHVTKIALEAWTSSSNLVLLGPTSVPRLAIFSFLVRHPATRRFLHHNFVTALLNDLFGIQARGGCACAGPYAQDLLGISEALAIEIEDLLVEDSRLDRVHLRRQREYSDKEILRPGFVRLNLPFFASDDVIQFVVDAVKMVAEHAWKFLPQYTFNPETGEWRHRSHQVFRDRKWLGFISYKTGCMAYRDAPCSENGPLPATHKECLEMAQKAVDQTSKVRVHIADQTVLFADGSNHLRWFLLPSEALSWLQDPARTAVSARVPFEPVRYPKQLESCVPRDEPSVHLDLANVGRSLGKVFSNGVTPRKAASAPALVGKDWAPQRKKVPKGRSRPKLSRCHSEDRAVSAITASLLADGFFAALKNIGQDTRSDNYAEGLQEVLSRGFAVDTLDANADDVAFDDASSEFSKNGVTQNGGHGKPRTKGKVQVRIVETEVTNKQLARKEFMSGDQNPVARSVQLGESAKEGLECRDGACFKKREHSDDVTDESTDGQHRHKWHPPNRKIFNPTIEALEEFGMIHDGDRVLVCLSGGKDSLSLLHCLHQYQFYAKKKGISFELGAVTVDPMTSAYDPSPLKGYLKALGLPYFYEEQAILEAAEKLGAQVESICSFCSRMKRGRIYLSARREGYNVLAMGQHLDDLAESFLMSVFHNGLLRTMKACYTVQEGDLRVIRPFVYVREKDLREFAELKKLPVISENCPACFEAPKERHRMKQLLAAQEVIFPRLFHSIKSAIKPILSINKTGVNVRTLFSQFQLQQDPDEDESEAV